MDPPIHHVRGHNSRAIRLECPLCARFRVREGDAYCSSCIAFLYEALGVHGSFDAIFERNSGMAPIIRANGPICYLCGVELTDHAEHVFPVAKGGKHSFSNLGGACWRCNLAKGDRILEPSDEQIVRLATQQAEIQAALDAVDVDAFWTWHWTVGWEDWINDAVEDLVDFYPDVDREDVRFYIEQVSEDEFDDYPFMPRELEERAIDEALRRIAASQ